MKSPGNSGGRPTPARRVMAEQREQQAVFAWIREHVSQYPELETAYHIPNEGKRSATGGANQVRQGLRRGMPDICLPAARLGWNALYIEMKAGRNTTMKDQENMIMLLRRHKNLALVARGTAEACQMMEEYLQGVMDVETWLARPVNAVVHRDDYYIGFCGDDCRQCPNKNCLGRKS